MRWAFFGGLIGGMIFGSLTQETSFAKRITGYQVAHETKADAFKPERP